MTKYGRRQSIDSDFFNAIAKTTLSQLHPSECNSEDIKDYDERFYRIFRIRDHQRKEGEDKFLCKAIDESIEGSKEWNSKEVRQILEVIFQSMFQRRKNPAGKTLEDSLKYFLNEAGIFYYSTQQTDIIVCMNCNDIKISCKNSQRDRKNDKDNDIQVFHLYEFSKGDLAYWATKGTPIVIIDYKGRKRAREDSLRLGIKAKILSLDEFMHFIKINCNY